MPHPTPFHCALITGASAGLGEEFALQLAPFVQQLVLVARRENDLHNLAERIKATHPSVAILVFPADLADPSDREDLIDSLILERFIPDLLVNNAGVGDYGEFASADWPRLKAMLDLNITALTHLTHALLPPMIRAQRGAIVNVSSLASLIPIPDFAVYAATKAYVTSFSEALRIELRDHHIPVLAVCPGPVHTQFGTVASRRGQSHDMPNYELFYIPKEQVVAESIEALFLNRPRVYPGLRIAAAALVLSALPIAALRFALSFRPRKNR